MRVGGKEGEGQVRDRGYGRLVWGSGRAGRIEVKGQGRGKRRGYFV